MTTETTKPETTKPEPKLGEQYSDGWVTYMPIWVYICVTPAGWGIGMTPLQAIDEHHRAQFYPAHAAKKCDKSLRAGEAGYRLLRLPPGATHYAIGMGGIAHLGSTEKATQMKFNVTTNRWEA